MTNTLEIWKPVDGHEGYEVSNLGRVAVIKNGERFIRKPNTATHYLSMSFRKRPCDTAQKSKTIHSMVAEAFHGPRPKGAIIRHIDGNRFNNRADNLAYGTKNENVYDAIAHGTYKGPSNGRALLDERHIALIRLLLETGTSLTAIAKAIGVSVGTIHAIKTGRNWGHVP